MHEMSLAEGVMELIAEAARREGFARVRTVWLEIGRLAAVETEALRFCFDDAMTGTLAEGARLEIIDLPGQAWCRQCQAEVALLDDDGICPQCGGFELRITGGDQMRVKELEVE
ncbi:hydrogenase maturation nickel metallochaperone HypA [Denitratisoma oestradiolicum]|uniref:Hydrogenase maturation factor HypA n=1 Tax=Denitratisoma oestradiolicum TaxID=311182 RepID=A0A6S6XWU3_9PROT|nr:hydrogenase maturation nickel metallochaperone HypA [Denitratisoma oestradiolicum]CAB1369424.1 protein involved with the maturation of hydrogenases 1 and 2 [Denitratisoma oestradiolicum]